MKRYPAAVLAALALLPLPALADGDVVLKFPANPSTGFHWVLDEAASTGLDLVTVEDRGYGEPETTMLGAPAPAFFAVHCTGMGPVRLVFDYTSPDGSTVAETRAAELTCD